MSRKGRRRREKGREDWRRRERRDRQSDEFSRVPTQSDLFKL